MSLYEEPERLVDSMLRAWSEGEADAATIAETFVRIADSGVQVRPGYVPTSKSPNKDGFIPVMFVESAEDVATAAALRRRKLVVRAPGLRKARERTANGFVGLSNGKARDGKARKGDRARRAIARFIYRVDQGLSVHRAVCDARKERQLLSDLLSHPDVRVLFSNKQRKALFARMRYCAAIVKAGTKAGYGLK